MISPATQLSLVNAKAYFREHLRVGDYYSESEKVSGEWFGKGADKLGLSGQVGEKEFLAMCEGLHPMSGEVLTARKNTTRTGANGENVANRRVLYDWVIRPPKSVSIVGLVHDSRIIDAHNEAVKIALGELEQYAQTRVRKGYESSDRDTGNVVAAMFRHDTSREQDPLIHTHCVIFNATHDKTEDRWKALQNKGMLRAQKLVSAVYDSELTKRLKGLGYGIKQNREQWEIAGISREMVEKFSKRRADILASARLAAERAGLDVDEFKLRDQIARDERKRKIRDASPTELRAKWREELGASGRRQVAETFGEPQSVKAGDVKSAAEWARQLVFERQVACRSTELEAAIMRRMLGEDFDRKEVRKEVFGPAVSRVEGTDKVVSHEAWRRETEILEVARNGRDMHRPLIADGREHKAMLDEGQGRVFDVIANSRDTITMLIGDAGVGKSYTMKRIHDAMKAEGKNVFVAAPQGVQARGLTDDGMPAETLSKFLGRQVIPHGAVVMLDEAGQVGGKDMAALLRRVDQVGGRVLLVGDTKQHGAVAASDAMKVLQNFGELPMARMTKIRRQDPSLGQAEEERQWIAKYRDAVGLAASGETIQSLKAMVDIGAVHEVAEGDKISKVTDTFVERSGEGEKVLVVSQTRAEVKELNERIAQRLEDVGRVKNGQDVRAFVGRDLLEAERRESDSYEAGQFVVFNRRYGQIEKGQVMEVAHVWRDGLTVKNTKSGKVHRVGLKHADKFESLEKRDIRIGDGTVLMMKRNGLALNGREYSNGERLTVAEVWPDEIRTMNDKGESVVLGRDSLVANLGYAVTSYSSQGKTVDRVVISDSQSAGAENEKEWYVSLSRGKKAAEVFTPSVHDFAGRIRKDGNRELAVALAGEMPRSMRPRRKDGRTVLQRSISRARRVVALARSHARRAAERATLSLRNRRAVTMKP